MSALLIGLCACAAALSGLIVRPASARQGEASTYKFTEGNIQFTVPAEWDVKSDKGTVTLSPKAGGGQVTFSAVPDAVGLNYDERERLLNGLIDKQKGADVKLGDYQDDYKPGELSRFSRPFTGKNGGRDVNGMYLLFGVPDKESAVHRYVFIAASSEQGAGEGVDKSIDALLRSIKRVE
jgi:hypothetical protein